MEFGMVGLEGFSSLPSSDHGKQKCCGSAGFLKHDRPVIVSHDDNDGFRASKIAKVRDDLTASKASAFVFSDDAQQEHNMLSFSSSPKLEDFSLKFSGAVESKSLQKSAFPNYFQYPTSAYSKISGEGVNASMYFLNGGGKGAFTPAQWIELEQQALIYKYIVANEPIPPNLLIPIRRALESAGFFSFPGGILRPTSFGYGWGPFHLGFANSTDPEPGRCRRTDGKKWRCAREAVPEQKYCERHMNRGRHRSRKPVEGRAGHSVSGSTPPTKLSNTSPNLVSVAADASNNFASDHPTSSLVNRLLLNKQNSSQGMQDATGLDFMSPPTISLNSSGANTFSIAKDHISFTESSSPIGFGLLTSDTLYRPYASSNDLNNTAEREPRHSARPFMDNFMSSTSSPTAERVIHSPLRLSGELEMGLGVGSDYSHNKQSSWVPISWETSMGGPLGEALKATSNNSESHSKNVSSALNLLSRGWEGSSPQLTSSSPTGVLQRTPLGSLSSSAGSSPRADHGRAPESGGSLGM